MRTLVLERHVPADPTSVFAAWTDVEQLVRWWWPMLPDTDYVVDARVGGFYRMASKSAGFGVHGQFVEVKPPHRLVMTWCWEDGDERGPIETVAVDFTPEPAGTAVAGTTVTVSHPCEDSDNLEQGWTDVLDRLVAFADHLG
ncbi:MAG TPA: SRPBCC domain-containing protein [Ilumatobacter sp.]|nr:SRPBCC domain-containing protein [Ilumatobacter sp.]